MKGQPLAYNKDNQEDKEPLFDAVDTITDTLRIFADMIPGITARPENLRDALRQGFATATRPCRLSGAQGVAVSATHTKPSAWPCGGPKSVASICRNCRSPNCSPFRR